MIPLREQEYIKQRFERELEGKVKLDFFTQRPSRLYVPGREECATCDDARKLYEELASLSDRVSLTTHEFADAREEAAKLGVDKIPAAVLRGPANRPLRFFGVPGGNEFPNFVETIIEASRQKAAVSAETAKRLKKLTDKASIAVYVTPTCPHCPGVVRAAYRLALASTHIDASAIEISEFPRLAQQLGVRAVPYIVINDQAAIAGAVDEAGLLEAIQKTAEGAPPGPARQAGETTETDPGQPPAASPASNLIIPR
ncbi:MAG: thioredoxin family protein [Dehalococcoidia bacterium]